jgi:hypothetical protein
MSTRTSRTQESRIELEQDRGLEALGLGLALGLPGAERSEPGGRARRGAGQPQRGAPAAGGPDPRSPANSVSRLTGS